MTMPEIRRATPQDLSAVLTIQQASPEAAQWTASQHQGSLTWVAIQQDTVAGFLSALAATPEEVEILNLAVSPTFRRQGIAAHLLATLLGFAPQADVFLEVRASNMAAQRFYQRQGFSVCGRRPRYYREPDDDALVLRRPKWYVANG